MRVVAERAAMEAQSHGSAHRKANDLPHGDLGRRGKTVDREQEQSFNARLVSAGCPHEPADQDRLTISSWPAAAAKRLTALSLYALADPPSSSGPSLPKLPMAITMYALNSLPLGTSAP